MNATIPMHSIEAMYFHMGLLDDTSSSEVQLPMRAFTAETSTSQLGQPLQ